MYIPEGFANGYYVLSSGAIFLSYNSNLHNPKLDTGILWNSFGFNWPIANPVISSKDENLPKLKNYKSKF
jgi:dTDP-4-dehydrorhamnose 3,5-epimerase-like enzyme